MVVFGEGYMIFKLLSIIRPQLSSIVFFIYFMFEISKENLCSAFPEGLSTCIISFLKIFNDPLF